MKTIRNLLVLIALGVVASAQSNSNSSAEQRYFNLEDSVQNRVDLSDAELAALANDDLMRTLRPDPSAPKLTQEGIEATVVHLCGSGERDLIAIGNGGELEGANVGPFWIIRDLPAGPVVVFSEPSLGLTIDNKRSNKCLNVESTTATAVEITTTQFHFNGEKYVVTRQKSAKLGQ
jgi:hypothetical protein